MSGLLADVNVEGTLRSLQHLLDRLGLLEILVEYNIEFVSFAQVGLAVDLADRKIWEHCQQNDLILLTDNRNNDGPNSLEATLRDSWQIGCLPVVTIGDKRGFELGSQYAERCAADIAEIFFGALEGQYCDAPRIYIPR